MHVISVLALEHVAEQFFHRSVADRAAEEQVLDAFRRDKSQQRQQQQQSTKPATDVIAESSLFRFHLSK